MAGFKSKAPTLTPEQAAQMLSNVFDICNVPPNTIPLETLESYSNYRAERFTFKRFLIGLIMAAFLLVPFLFIAPHMETVDVSSAPGAPEYEITVDSLLPITHVTAEINGANVPVFETGDGVYTIKPAASGTMVVTATAANRQIRQVELDVFADRHDKEAPSLVNNEIVDGHVYLYLSDDDSGVDYSSAFGEYADGTRAYPITFNSTEGCVVFKYPSEDMTVYISDCDGNSLELNLTVE